jgi:hypothetical protein
MNASAAYGQVFSALDMDEVRRQGEERAIAQAREADDREFRLAQQNAQQQRRIRALTAELESSSRADEREVADLLRQGRTREAFDAIQRLAASAPPSEAAAWWGKLAILASGQEPARHREAIRRALDLAPDDFEITWIAADSALEDNRLEEAERLARRMLTLAEGDSYNMAQAWGQLGFVASDRGDYQAALDYSERDRAASEQAVLQNGSFRARVSVCGAISNSAYYRSLGEMNAIGDVVEADTTIQCYRDLARAVGTDEARILLASSLQSSIFQSASLEQRILRLEETIAIRRTIRDPARDFSNRSAMSRAWTQLGHAHLAMGDRAAAERSFREALLIAQGLHAEAAEGRDVDLSMALLELSRAGVLADGDSVLYQAQAGLAEFLWSNTPRSDNEVIRLLESNVVIARAAARRLNDPWSLMALAQALDQRARFAFDAGDAATTRRLDDEAVETVRAVLALRPQEAANLGYVVFGAAWRAGPETLEGKTRSLRLAREHLDRLRVARVERDDAARRMNLAWGLTEYADIVLVADEPGSRALLDEARTLVQESRNPARLGHELEFYILRVLSEIEAKERRHDAREEVCRQMEALAAPELDRSRSEYIRGSLLVAIECQSEAHLLQGDLSAALAQTQRAIAVLEGTPATARGLAWRRAYARALDHNFFAEILVEQQPPRGADVEAWAMEVGRSLADSMMQQATPRQLYLIERSLIADMDVFREAPSADLAESMMQFMFILTLAEINGQSPSPLDCSRQPVQPSGNSAAAWLRHALVAENAGLFNEPIYVGDTYAQRALIALSRRANRDYPGALSTPYQALALAISMRPLNNCNSESVAGLRPANEVLAAARSANTEGILFGALGAAAEMALRQQEFESARRFAEERVAMASPESPDIDERWAALEARRQLAFILLAHRRGLAPVDAVFLNRFDNSLWISRSSLQAALPHLASWRAAADVLRAGDDESAVAAQANAAEAAFHHGWALEMLGQTPQARTVFREAQTLNARVLRMRPPPDLREAAEARAEAIRSWLR